MRLRVLTVDFQKVLGAGPAVQLVDVLGDDHDPAALLAQPGLTLGNGKVPRVRLRAPHDFPPVVVELPHPGRVVGKGPGSGQVLGLESRPESEGRKRQAPGSGRGAGRGGTLGSPPVVGHACGPFDSEDAGSWGSRGASCTPPAVGPCRVPDTGQGLGPRCLSQFWDERGTVENAAFTSPVVRQGTRSLSHLPLEQFRNMKLYVGR